MTEGATKCLLVGGPADGRRMKVPDHLMGVWITEMKPVSMQVFNPKAPPTIEDERFVRHQYLRELLSTPNKQWSFFRWAGVTVEEAMNMLIENYPLITQQIAEQSR